MNHSSFLPDKPEIWRNLPNGFMVNFDGNYFIAPKFKLATLPAGNLYSTVNDLAKFMLCLFNDGKFGNHRLITKATLKEMLRVQSKEADQFPQFGLGFAVGNFRDLRSFWHNGLVYGFSSDFLGLTDEKIGVIVLNNVDGATGFNEKIKLKAFHLLFSIRKDEDSFSFPQFLDDDDLISSEYEGKYQSKNLFAWVFVKNGRLFLTSMGVTKWIRPTGRDAFISDDRISFGLPVKFYRDNSNRSKI